MNFVYGFGQKMHRLACEAGRCTVGLTAAGIAAKTVPGVASFATKKILTGVVGHTAAAALGMPASGGASLIVIPLAYKHGKELPANIKKFAHNVEQAYRSHEMSRVTAPTATTLRGGVEVSRFRAIKFKNEDEDGWIAADLY